MHLQTLLRDLWSRATFKGPSLSRNIFHLGQLSCGKEQ
jgi:hypothetical protein